MYIALAPQKDQAAAFPTTGATSQTPASVPRTDASTSAPPHTPPQVPHVPFALVDIVTPSSPAETAGLLVGDRILSFGAVSLRAFATPNLAMGALPGLLRDHENRTVDVAVERSDGPALTAHTLNLTPRRWSGQGLLGCHVVPLTVNQVDSRYAPQVEVEAAVKSNADKV